MIYIKVNKLHLSSLVSFFLAEGANKKVSLLTLQEEESERI